jgi:hypothetical protein
MEIKNLFKKKKKKFSKEENKMNERFKERN